MEKIFDLLLNSFDFGYMIAVNIVTYLIIKIIDELNGEKAVPVWAKRLTAVGSGLLIVFILYLLQQPITPVFLYSFIASLVSWDIIFKPLLKYYKKLDYKQND